MPGMRITDSTAASPDMKILRVIIIYFSISGVDKRRRHMPPDGFLMRV